MNRRYRKTIIAGNWKMNKTPAEAKALIEEMKPLLSKTKWCEMVLCVPFTDIQAAVKAAKGSKIAIGAENMHFEKSGAFTGEISADMLKELFPDAKNVGLLYCSAEPNSKYQIDTIKPLLEAQGYTCTEFAFTDSNDVASVAQNAASGSDVIYIPTDNTAASCTEAIANVVIPAKVPVIAGEQGICSGCGVATLSIDYNELGQATGEMAYEILVKGANPGDMEVQAAPTFTKMYNKANCEKLGITIPDDYTAIEG